MRKSRKVWADDEAFGEGVQAKRRQREAEQEAESRARAAQPEGSLLPTKGSAPFLLNAIVLFKRPVELLDVKELYFARKGGSCSGWMAPRGVILSRIAPKRFQLRCRQNDSTVLELDVCDVPHAIFRVKSSPAERSQTVNPRNNHARGVRLG